MAQPMGLVFSRCFSSCAYWLPDRVATTSDNELGGLWCKLYICKPKARSSEFLRNGKYEIFNESPEIWDFSAN